MDLISRRIGMSTHVIAASGRTSWRCAGSPARRKPFTIKIRTRVKLAIGAPGKDASVKL
jgi:hypothetical protein